MHLNRLRIIENEKVTSKLDDATVKVKVTIKLQRDVVIQSAFREDLKEAEAMMAKLHAAETAFKVTAEDSAQLNKLSLDISVFKMEAAIILQKCRKRHDFKELAQRTASLLERADDMCLLNEAKQYLKQMQSDDFTCIGELQGCSELVSEKVKSLAILIDDRERCIIKDWVDKVESDAIEKILAFSSLQDFETVEVILNIFRDGEHAHSRDAIEAFLRVKDCLGKKLSQVILQTLLPQWSNDISRRVYDVVADSLVKLGQLDFIDLDVESEKDRVCQLAFSKIRDDFKDLFKVAIDSALDDDLEKAEETVKSINAAAVANLSLPKEVSLAISAVLMEAVTMLLKCQKRRDFKRLAETAASLLERADDMCLLNEAKQYLKQMQSDDFACIGELPGYSDFVSDKVKSLAILMDDRERRIIKDWVDKVESDAIKKISALTSPEDDHELINALLRDLENGAHSDCEYVQKAVENIKENLRKKLDELDLWRVLQAEKKVSEVHFFSWF